MTICFSIAYSEESLKYLENIQSKNRKQIINKIASLASNPRPSGVRKIRGMSEISNNPGYRKKVGKYRILYCINESRNEIFIFKIQTRDKVYLNIKHLEL
ncbi:type II toxin-antitoxin system RelE family toxin [Liberibacter crescens]|uniref:type II toxin-antitoxin system RelE family toxin n=1 Tax=Liberibacter crescens TaxID=1273132 RepID=UPI0002FF5706|nr:type II toxin-antitoxin system RelE/ParE family toxin [Liberibacter crescens]